MGGRLDSSFQQQAFLPAREIGLNDRQTENSNSFNTFNISDLKLNAFLQRLRNTFRHQPIVV
jgi:hypothetical protein